MDACYSTSSHYLDFGWESDYYYQVPYQGPFEHDYGASHCYQHVVKEPPQASTCDKWDKMCENNERLLEQLKEAM